MKRKKKKKLRKRNKFKKKNNKVSGYSAKTQKKRPKKEFK